MLVLVVLGGNHDLKRLRLFITTILSNLGFKVEGRIRRNRKFLDREYPKAREIFVFAIWKWADGRDKALYKTLVHRLHTFLIGMFAPWGPSLCCVTFLHNVFLSK